MSDDAVAVDVVVEVTTIVIDAVALGPVEAIDVTSPPAVPVVIDAVMLSAGAVEVTVPDPSPIAIDVFALDPTEAVDVTVPVTSPIVVEPIVILGGPPGPAGAGGATGTVGTFGSTSPITPGTTAYIGVGWSVTEAKAHFQVLMAGTVTDFGVSIGTALGTGTIVATLRKNGIDTSLVVTLSGSDQYEYVSGSVVFAKGDRASIKAVVSADVPGNVIITPSWRLVPS